jgi:hypothetical protein
MCKDWQQCLEEHIVENDYQIQPFTLCSITKYQSKSHMFSFTTTAAVPTNVE